MIKRVSWVWSAIAVASAACSSNTNSSGDGGPSTGPGNAMLQMVCNDLSTQLCSKLNSCSSFAFSLAYPDMNTCITRVALTCPSGANANGSGATVAALQACSQAYSTANCADLVSGKQPDACNIHGTLMTGAPCGSSVQCAGANSFCNIPGNQVCGTCDTLAALGGPCAQITDCQLGLACSSTGMCVTPGTMGAACSAMQPCATSLSCVNAKCAAPGGMGDTCDPNAQNCDYTKGLFCNVSNKCVAYQMAGPGAMCGLSTTSTSYTLCTGTGLCPSVNMSVRGTCPTVPADNAACDPMYITSVCLPPAACVNSKCVLSDPSSCH
jgi:hypothetical protein